MKAMILAAGRGKRLKPFTDSKPKALVELAGKPLIAYHLDALSRAGITEVVINLAHLGEQIKETLGDGSAFNLTIHYSQEPTGGLETGGGIVQALPILGEQPFIVMNADIFTDYPLQNLKLAPKTLAHLVLVDNPSYHTSGDFSLTSNKLSLPQDNALTFSGIGLYHPDLFKDYQPGFFPLGPIIKSSLENITAEHYTGQWWNINTMEELKAAESKIAKQ